MIGASRAFIIYVVAMVGLGILAAFKPTTPALAFFSQLTIGFTAYITKRLLQKGEKFQNNSSAKGDQSK